MMRGESRLPEKLVYDGLQRCPYLPGQVARLPLYRQDRRLTPDETDERLARAERRMGRCLYHAACPTCRACEGLRIDVAGFQPSKSQRRVLSRWGDRGRILYGTPTIDDEKLALYQRHKRERGLADADDPPMTAEAYQAWLVDSCMWHLEMRYYWLDRLVGVGIVDLGRTAASSVYFYFDPEIGELSPGVYSVLQEVELCRRTHRAHLYLGLYVADCSHLAYKAGYRPHQRRIDGAWSPG